MRLVRALEAFREQAQFVVAIAERRELFYRRQHVLPVRSRTTVALPYIVDLLRDGETAGILPMTAIDHVTKRPHALARIVVQPHRTPDFAIDQRDLLARAQIGDGVGALFRRHAVGDATAV